MFVELTEEEIEDAWEEVIVTEPAVLADWENALVEIEVPALTLEMKYSAVSYARMRMSTFSCNSLF